MIKSKKGEGDPTQDALVGTVIWIVALCLVFLPIGLTLYKVFSGQPNSQTINSLELIAHEVKYLEGKETIPLYVDKDHMIKGFDSLSSSKPDLCGKDKSCICVCKLNDCSSGQVNKCIDLEYDVNKNKLTVNGGFVVMPSDKIKNYVLSIDGQDVSIA